MSQNFSNNKNQEEKVTHKNEFTLFKVTSLGQLEQFAQFGMMAENLVNCTQYHQSKELNPNHLPGQGAAGVEYSMLCTDFSSIRKP